MFATVVKKNKRNTEKRTLNETTNTGRNNEKKN